MKIGTISTSKISYPDNTFHSTSIHTHHPYEVGTIPINGITSINAGLDRDKPISSLNNSIYIAFDTRSIYKWGNNKWNLFLKHEVKQEIIEESKNKLKIFQQTSLSNDWIIKHNLGKLSTIIVEDDYGNEIFPKVINSFNKLRIIFNIELTGFVFYK